MVADSHHDWCGRRRRQTRHTVIHRAKYKDNELGAVTSDTLQCLGCQSVSLKEVSANDGVVRYGPSKPWRSDLWERFTAFPPENLSDDLLALINEVYTARDSGGNSHLDVTCAI